MSRPRDEALELLRSEEVRARLRHGDDAAARGRRAELLRSLAEPRSGARPRPLWRRSALRWAAAAALAVSAALFAERALERGAASLGPEERLAAWARELSEARTELFGDFEPLGRAERTAEAPAERLRAGVPFLYPASRVPGFEEALIDRRPSFRWEVPPLAGAFAVALHASDGTLLWTRTTERPPLAYPPDEAPLEPSGRYFWKLSFDSPLDGPTSVTAPVFRAASAAERAAFEEGLAEIDARVPEPDRGLIEAHWALRRGHLGRAEELARSRVEAREDAPGLETLLCVLERMGHPDAEGVRARLAALAESAAASD